MILYILDNKWNFELFNTRKILFKDLHIENIVSFISYETDSLAKENNSCDVGSCRKAMCDTESLDGSMGLSRIFLNHDNDVF